MNKIFHNICNITIQLSGSHTLLHSLPFLQFSYTKLTSVVMQKPTGKYNKGNWVKIIKEKKTKQEENIPILPLRLSPLFSLSPFLQIT